MPTYSGMLSYYNYSGTSAYSETSGTAYGSCSIPEEKKPKISREQQFLLDKRNEAIKRQWSNKHQWANVKARIRV